MFRESMSNANNSTGIGLLAIVIGASCLYCSSCCCLSSSVPLLNRKVPLPSLPPMRAYVGDIMPDGSVTGKTCPAAYTWCLDPSFNDPYTQVKEGTEVWGGTKEHADIFRGNCCKIGKGSDDPAARKNSTQKFRDVQNTVADYIVPWGSQFNDFIYGSSDPKCRGPTAAYGRQGKKDFIFSGDSQTGVQSKGDTKTWYVASSGCPFLTAGYV